MAAFFIPGVSDDAVRAEAAYADMRWQIECDMGRAPSMRRIESLWARRGSVDCITEVGRPDPVGGGMVMAIFDMGPHKPFVVWTEPAIGQLEGVREILGCTAYSTAEFDL